MAGVSPPSSVGSSGTNWMVNFEVNSGGVTGSMFLGSPSGTFCNGNGPINYLLIAMQEGPQPIVLF